MNPKAWPWCALAILILVRCVSGAHDARAVSPSVAASPSEGAFPLVAGTTAADLYFDADEPAMVSLAASMFADDVERVTGRRLAVRDARGLAGEHAAAVFVGTLGHSRLIDSLATAGKLDVSPTKGQWEAFTLSLVTDPAPGVKRALVIAGSDRRGTAYGVLTLSETIGVSPWYWWADVPPTQRSTLYLSVPAPFHDAPAVKYRGIFINDEDWGLNPWASKTFDPQFKNIGPKTYEKVFELMLRLRLNYIWPAMHACSTEFAATPENVALADKYAIVAGSSHCEPMLCNNVHWDQKTRGPWNYSTNRDTIRKYWQDMAKARGSEEAVWTLGIRGIHDAGMQTPPTDMPGKIELMTEVIRDQRALLDQYVTTRYGPVAQCFVPYKEVLPIYDAGLKVPEDVTLVWVDDNFGYIRRLSAPEERKRTGGSGVYYHISYYGSPHSYTWINTTPPALIWEELHKAWDNDARRLWVLNVGDIKPMEIGIDYFARLAWNPEGLGPDSQPTFLRDFAAKNFGEKLAHPMADLLGDFYRLGTVRKPELMDRAWAMALPSERAEQLGRDYRSLLQHEAEIAETIPPEARDAYTETIGFPARVLGSAGLIFMADRDAQQGRDVAANEKEIAKLRTDLEARVEAFNTRIAGGKWRHMLPGLETGKDLAKWSSQVRWPWGEKAEGRGPARHNLPSPPARVWRDAASADRQSAGGAAQWTVIAGLGQTGRAMSVHPSSLASSWKLGDSSAPRLEFDFVSLGGDAEAFIDFLPAFRIFPGMKLRVAVNVDDLPEIVLEVPGSSGSEDERGSVRADAVQDNYVRARVPLPGVSAGKHVFKIRAIDPGTVIDRVSLP